MLVLNQPQPAPRRVRYATLHAIIAMLLFASTSRVLAEVKSAEFRPPSDQIRMWHLWLDLGIATGDMADTRVSIDGQRLPFMKNVSVVKPTSEGQHLPNDNDALKGAQLYGAAAFDWQAGHKYEVTVRSGNEEQTLEVTAPAEKPFPYAGWRQHRILVLQESAGLERTGDPMRVVLSASARDVTSFMPSLRVARIDMDTLAATEVPSQVLFEKRSGRPGSNVTAEIAFLAACPANGRAWYLIAYDNDEAPPTSYDTGMKLSEAEDGALGIDNGVMRVDLHPKSRQINGLTLSRFGESGNPTFASKQYQIHYSPDAWIAGRSWSHANKWDPPPNMSIEAGPVAVVVRRWGPLPWVPEVELNTTYTIFHGVPYVFIKTNIDITADVNATALRDDEIVLAPPELVDHFAWRDMAGEIHLEPVVYNPDKVPGMVDVQPGDIPWVAMLREKDRLGVGSVRINRMVGTRGGEPAIEQTAVTIMADYGWGFRYISRPLVFPWGDRQRDNSTTLNAKTFYAAESAMMIFPWLEGEKPAAQMKVIDDVANRLQAPLQRDHQGTGPW